MDCLIVNNGLNELEVFWQRASVLLIVDFCLNISVSRVADCGLNKEGSIANELNCSVHHYVLII
jgi:hypothetical protein